MNQYIMRQLGKMYSTISLQIIVICKSNIYKQHMVDAIDTDRKIWVFDMLISITAFVRECYIVE